MLSFDVEMQTALMVWRRFEARRVCYMRKQHISSRITILVSNLFLDPFISRSDGKEVLIKAVAMALPTYSMSCFLIPKTLLKIIIRLISSFWWKNQESGKGIHWKSWNNLCKSKKDGGMGFRDLEGFNLALLGKQLWRMSVEPQSLLARIYKYRYFPNSSVLQAKLGNRPSYAWRSIRAAQALMSKGMKKEIGNGQHMDWLSDPWIVDPLPRPPKLRNNFDPESFNINYLKEPNSDEWRINALNYMFVKEDVPKILEIKPGSCDSEKQYSWIHNNDGNYTVKSGYWCWCQHIKDSQASTNREGPSLSPLYSQAWTTLTSPKIKNFIWRVLSNSIAVAQNMEKKKLTKINECSRCGDIEDVNHLLFTCPYARVVWASSPLGMYYHPYPHSSIYSNLAICLQPREEKNKERVENEKIWPWILWRLWKSRNDLVFSNLDSNPLLLIKQAADDASEWLEANKKEEARRPTYAQAPRRTSNWTPPPVGKYKCNIDASWNVNDKTCGVGWILRDSAGNVKWIGAKSYPKLTSPLQAEAAALTWALSCLNNLQLDDVTIESDCQSLIQALTRPKDWHCLRQTILEAKVQQERRGYTFGFANRGANTCADAIARVIKLCPMYYAILDNNVPSWLLHSVETDRPHVANVSAL